MDGSRIALENMLIADLKGEMRTRAQYMRQTDAPSFSDQYWRKYQQPFRFRLLSKMEKAGHTVPHYWGRRMMIRACDGNCRRFIRLADLCWQLYWSNGLRPLTALEQNRALTKWAANIVDECAVLPVRGQDLKEITDRIAKTLRIRLINTESLGIETLVAKIESFNEAQSEAIAIGIAHGYLVPQVSDDNELGEIMKYPTVDVRMRLGFPVAVNARLPLRSGAAAAIKNLKQVEFPWWQP
jgi:hypothetical protein